MKIKKRVNFKVVCLLAGFVIFTVFQDFGTVFAGEEDIVYTLEMLLSTELIITM
jgi:hypothetical protein